MDRAASARPRTTAALDRRVGSVGATRASTWASPDVRVGRTCARPAFLEEVGTHDAATEEQRSLRDRANLALGFASLQQHAPDVCGCRAEPRAARWTVHEPRAARCSAGPSQTPTIPSAHSCRGSSCSNHKLLGRRRPGIVPRRALRLRAARIERQARSALSIRGGCLWSRRSRRIDESIAVIRAGGFLDAILDRPSRTSNNPAGSGSSRRLPDAPAHAVSLPSAGLARVPGRPEELSRPADHAGQPRALA